MLIKSNLRKIIPVMFSFFVMGFVDMVGISTNYVQADLNLSNTEANIFPSMVFFWFLLFSVPAGMLMNKVGRKRTVLFSIVVTIAALLLPLVIPVSYSVMLASFALLGIGNTLMQVSLNPLVSNIVTGERLASAMTFGQFVKAIASFVAPLIAAWGVIQYGNWLILYPIFCGIAVVAYLLLWYTRINEHAHTTMSGYSTTGVDDPADKGDSAIPQNTTFGRSFGLLGNWMILLCFLGIFCHVGIDVGTNVTAPKLLMERLGIPLVDAGIATSIYFLFRTVGCLTGSFILMRMSSRMFFVISTLMILCGMAILAYGNTLQQLYIGIGLIGYGNSNIFSILFSTALLLQPGKQNEVSGLMIMGLFGGTVFPFVMGVVSDYLMAQVGAIIVMLIGCLYLLWLGGRLPRKYTPKAD